MSAEQLKTAIHQALRAWHKTEFQSDHLLQELLIVQAEQEALSGSAGPDSLHLAVNRVLLDGLETLGKSDKEGAEILRRRFLNQSSGRALAFQMNLSEDSIYRRQAAAIAELANLIWLREERARREYTQRLEGRLPPQSYAELFGVTAIARALEQKLLAAGEPWLVAVTGIGGIGKTALADYVARLAIARFRFRELAFVRVEMLSMSGRSRSAERVFEQIVQELARALDLPPGAADRAEPIRQRLKARPHLIIVDNLEEAADVAYLLPRLAGWANPSKFILTSRARPLTTETIAIHALDELPDADALALVRHEAATRGLDAVVAAADEELLPLCATIGGNPLALKMAVALLQFMPMPAVLGDLQQGQTRSVREMYKHIYWTAWRSLSPDAQALLEAMPLVGQVGGTQEQLQAITHLDDGQLWQAVQELNSRSLLEMRGSLWERRYGIHRLTETFVNSEITGWMREEDEDEDDGDAPPVDPPGDDEEEDEDSGAGGG